MEWPGLTTTISLASGLVLAIPMAIIGFEFLARGSTILGIVFLGLSVAMLALPEYLYRQIPRPRAMIRNRLTRDRGGKQN